MRTRVWGRVCVWWRGEVFPRLAARPRHRPAAHARPNLSLVHSSRGRNARTHKQPSPVGAKSRGQSARKRRTLVMAAEIEGWRRALPTVGISHADIRRRTRAWPPLACVPANRLSAHQETYPRSGVSVERSRRGSVSEVITAGWAGSRSLGKNLDVGDLPLQEPRQGLDRQPTSRLLL